MPTRVAALYARVSARARNEHTAWRSKLNEYCTRFDEEGQLLVRRMAGRLPDDWQACLPVYEPGDAALATRKTSETCLAALSGILSEIMSGSADLTPSNFTRWKSALDFQHPASGLGSYEGSYL